MRGFVKGRIFSGPVVPISENDILWHPFICVGDPSAESH